MATMFKRNSKYEQALVDYDPKIHGSMKEYTKELGLNYSTFKKNMCLYRRYQGIPAQKQTNYDAFYEELAQSNEPIIDFCRKRKLNYENFRQGWYKYRKRNGLDISRSRKVGQEEQ